MSGEKLKPLGVLAIAVALTLTGMGIQAVVVPESDVVTGAQKYKGGIRTGQLNVTTTDTGMTEFWAHTYPQNGTDIRELRIHWETPKHNYTLSPVFTHNPDSLSGTAFSVQVIRDKDGGFPHANSGGDYVRITVRPRTFVSKNESALGPVKITIDAPEIYRERIILRNVTGTANISRPAERVTLTPTEEPWPNYQIARDQTNPVRRTTTAPTHSANRSGFQ